MNTEKINGIIKCEREISELGRIEKGSTVLIDVMKNNNPIECYVNEIIDKESIGNNKVILTMDITFSIERRGVNIFI